MSQNSSGDKPSDTNMGCVIIFVCIAMYAVGFSSGGGCSPGPSPALLDAQIKELVFEVDRLRENPCKSE